MRDIFYLPENQNPNQVDILLITGDAYIDHPSFGIAIIARVLHHSGYSIAIASQPEYHNPSYLELLPEPKLFIGISSGNIDSVVNNHTGNRHRRDKDTYSIDGKTVFPDGKPIRPDRAVITYTSFIKRRFKGVPVVIGGIEASLRRFAHYDYVQQKVRRSILLDSKADILVYSMGEKATLEIARRLSEGRPIIGIDGTMVRANEEQVSRMWAIELPSLEDIKQDKQAIVKSTKLIEANMVWHNANNLYQKEGKDIVLSFRPQEPLTTDEMDWLYNLPFRRDYPGYCRRVPAWNMIKDSITSHRGCYGRCAFCAISSHQGAVVTSRSEGSVLAEAVSLTAKGTFKGTISDIGGPTANMYGTHCRIGWCKDPHCLYPKVCENLFIGDSYGNLLRRAKALKGVKHVFVASGLRHDLALMKKEETEWIIRWGTSGHLKVAPENISDDILRLMKKPPIEVFEQFLRFFNEVKRKHHLRFYILPYIILSHPGSDDRSVHELADFFIRYGLRTQQYQDFTPTPQTLSTAMFYSGKDGEGNVISVPNPSSIKNKQREILKRRLKSHHQRVSPG